MNVIIITICTLLTIGIVLIIWGISLKYKNFCFINKCSEICNGILIKLNEIEIGHQVNNDSSSRWHTIKSDVPIYEYEVSGVKYKVKGTNGYGFKLGDIVKINYNPKNPNECYIDGYSFKAWMVLLIIGIILIIMSFLFYLMFKLIF